MKLLNKSFGFIFLVVLGLIVCPVFVRSEDSVDEDGGEDAVVNDEPAADPNAATETEAEEGEEKILASPFVKTNVLFTDPESTEFPAGKVVKLLVGFHNNGSSSFLVEGVEGSFRYPQDFSYYIQNFTGFQFNKVVETQKEATFEYMFTPSETFSSRQFGLTINLRYKDADGKQFLNTVFNETISVVEPDEGFDGETFFLYIFLAAIAVLLAVVVQNFLPKKLQGKKSNYSHKQTNGNASDKGYDESWIPKEHLSGKEDKSPRVSPRQRKGYKNGNGVSANGHVDE